MSIFKITDHPKFPNYYKYCENTGTCFYIPAKERSYSNSYFMEEYKAQYKKTYYEDEQSLRSLAKRRLAVLEKFNRPRKTKLLEVGSAAGFFLDEARKIGYNTKGIEISESEVNYAKDKLGLDVENISFLDFDAKNKYDCIALFFVLEHFPDQETVLNKIFSLLNESGYLFLALPSIYGPSFSTNPEEWFKTHPEDHFADYSPFSLKKVFQYFNAKILYCEPMSYHVSRDKGMRGKFPFRFFYNSLARLTSYGDTIQILAQRR
ncbi:MAG TPA: class I SAM-dependent methyltransferase [Leptospiraceae bacterium]|nr:class I SAM-dependent methyltransferase [Leptospiraceae bacterium]HMW04275.1 class I SAM-dependent methyltransferase [Leptospiraceae bacterium]HMX30621.1 class I SAM-dependent methyltransferase [Leptospiraceae bacterium]HMY31321.1 class I SAM-dependent methyltransferase [Leptospiraceae bacterium]HMZ63434.1 class I SAM-dependent methyltransferase [Leptospiraceae bacterium]